MESTVLGYPRIGPQRELKKATEAFWAGRGTAADLDADRRRPPSEHLGDAAGRGPVRHPLEYVLPL